MNEDTVMPHSLSKNLHVERGLEPAHPQTMHIELVVDMGGGVWAGGRRFGLGLNRGGIPGGWPGWPGLRHNRQGICQTKPDQQGKRAAHAPI